MRLHSGIKLLEEREGSGTPAKKGDRVVYNLKIFLNQGDEVLLNERQAEHLPQRFARHARRCRARDFHGKGFSCAGSRRAHRLLDSRAKRFESRRYAGGGRGDGGGKRAADGQGRHSRRRYHRVDRRKMGEKLP